MADDKEEQQAELLALKSIFDENTLEIIDENSGRLIIDVEAPNDGLFPFLAGSSQQDKSETIINVQYLSPLYLSFTFVSNYPSKSAPIYKLQALWLTPLLAKRLEKLLEKIWQESIGNPVLFNWYQSIQENIYNFFDRPIHLNELNAPVNQLIDALTDYDRLKKRRLFETRWFTCTVCCRDYLGGDCEKLSPCSHIFCRQCCRSYLTVQVQDGALDRMKCLADDCQTPIGGQQLRSILGQELYDRYEQLSLLRGLDSMTDIVQCPRPDCGAPVLTDGPDSKMACCVVCHLPFCLYCKKVFHGVAPCTFSMGDKKKIMEEYKTAPSDVRLKMERRYGKQTLQRLLDESMSEEWMTEHSKACPHCRMGIEKNDGCNKMACSKCGTYFCWLCLRILNEIDPYKHFSDPKAPCFNKLFMGMTTDEQDGAWYLPGR